MNQVISIVIPILDEIENLGPLYGQVVEVLESVRPEVDFELVFVDDGSTDGSRERMRTLCEQDPRVRLIELSRNFGHQLAITAGIDHSIGDAVVVMDGDLQDPPEVIPELITKWREGVDVVYAVREARGGESRTKRVAASLHYRLLNWLSDVDIPLDTGDFRLISRQVADQLVGMRESSRYLRGMVAWVGFRQDSVRFHREPRNAGEAKYNYRTLMKLSLDGITGFTDRPLRLAHQVGLLVTAIAALYGSYIIIAKLIDPTRATEGFATLIVAVLFIGGLQLFAIGLLGQYLGRVFTETKERPLYIVSAQLGEGTFRSDDMSISKSDGDAAERQDPTHPAEQWPT